MRDRASCVFISSRWRTAAVAALLFIASLAVPASASASDQIFFPAVDNVIDKIVQKINAETVRVDISTWYLTEHAISIAIANKFNAGVPVRLIGDRGSIFEIDPNTKAEFYWLANQGVPIRLRFNPTWYPEINHWKMAIFVGQNVVEFGSANWVTFELAPASANNYDDETAMFTDDPVLVNAFKTKFDQMWNDTTVEPQSIAGPPPYLKDWNDACANEPLGCDFHTQYPSARPMVINTARLEPDNAMPPDLIWGQGPDFNNRLVQEINNEPTFLQFVIYRLTVNNITDALLARWQAGVQMQLIVEPQEYLNKKWPEFWLTHANIDKLWAAGIPIKQRAHQGLTHMKTLVTAAYASNASSNYAAAWQRDHDYFVSSATKPSIYTAIKNRVTAMWNDSVGFTTFQPQPPDAVELQTPASGGTGVPTTASLVWKIAAFATDYDVYLGTSPGSMVKVANVPAQLVNNPPSTYSWTPPGPLQGGTTYYWKVVARTNATPVNPALIGSSSNSSFTTAGSAGPPAAPTTPSPTDGATSVSTAPTLGWAPGAVGTTYSIAFGTSTPPPQVATNLTNPSYAPGALASNTTYYWRVTSTSGGGSTPGPLWSFVTGTGSGGGNANDIVIYAADVPAGNLHGSWSQVADATAAAHTKLSNPDAGAATIDPALANPTNYFEVTFDALGNTPYRVWFRIHAIGDTKLNDSIFVQYSDTVSGGSPIYRIGTPGAVNVNLWTCATCQSVGWGWQRNAYWLPDTGDVIFQNSGSHTMRVQVREDGVEIDQIVLSPSTYAQNPPGPVSNDTTIVPKPSLGPGTPALPSPTNGATDVPTNATLGWSSAGGTSFDVHFGTTNPPPLVEAGVSSSFYSPGTLLTATTYFWQIIAHNANGSTTGPVWTFATVGSAPSAPTTPSPAAGATNVSTTPTLTWSAPGATSYEVRFGTANPPPTVSASQAAASYTPSSALAFSTTYFWQIVATNGGGSTAGPVWSFTTAAQSAPPAPDVVLYATDLLPGATHGAWTTAADATAAGGVRVQTPDSGVANTNAALAAPADFVDFTFDAPAGTYRFWMRMQALANAKANDSVWVQFSDATASGSPIYQIGTPAALLVNLATDAGAGSLNAWGWQNGAYWLDQPTAITFTTSGSHTIRIQTREDGAQIDQIVLSPATYLNAAPGGVSNDHTIVPKPSPPQAPAAPASPSPANAATGVSMTPTLTWSASGATSYDVAFGTANPPPTVSTSQPSASYTPPTLAATTTYFWQITARNAAGTTVGAVWSFTTGAPPAAPGMPSTPSPADGATAVNVTPTLTWSSTGATSFDVKFGTANPPPQVVTGQSASSYAPAGLASNTTYFWQIVSHNGGGTTTGPVWSFTTGAGPIQNVVIYAADIPPAALHGSWTVATDPQSPSTTKVVTTDTGFTAADAPLAAPAHYVDVTFSADAGRPYTVWLRLKALNNSKFNDAVWVQFSDATSGGSPIYPVNSTSGLLVNLATTSEATSLNGWGWQNSAYWMSQPTTVTFATSGTHTMRIQVREDGVQLDQIVLSATTYLSVAPGSVTNDGTIVPKP